MRTATNRFFRICVLTLVLGGLMAFQPSPKAARRLLVRGQYAAMNQSYKTALKLFNKAILLKADYDTAFYHRGVLKATIQDINGAIADFSQAVQLNAGYSQPYFSRGTLYLQHGYQQKALVDFEAAIQINPYFYDALNNKAVLLNNMGQAQQARQIYDSLIVNMEKLIARKDLRPQVAGQQPRPDTYQYPEELRPRIARLYFNRSFIKVKSNNLEGALEDLNKSLDHNSWDYGVHYHKGEVLLQLNQTKKALQAFEQARSLYPAAFYGHLNLGKAYAAAGQRRKAITIFSQAIRRNQRSGEAYYLRGSERLKQNKLEKAWSDLRLAQLLGYGAAAEKLQQLEARFLPDQN